jgi:uncharacterized protein YndB with AHSA1/START domain
MKSESVVIERTYSAPIEKVWKALTSSGDMKEWYFDIPGFKAEVGCEYQFVGGTVKKKYLHLCKVTAVIPGRKLTHSWKYDGYEGMSSVTFEIEPEGSATKLTLTHEGLETFPQSNPDFARKNFVEGWTYIAGTALKKFVET